MPVTELSVMIGAAIAPNATGAVLANNETTAALIGFMPAAISMAAEMATGAPKPASDSSSAPKQKAMRMAWMRWSSEIDRILIAEYLEPAGDHRQAVHPDGVDEDPQNGEQAVHRTFECRASGLPQRHPPYGDGDHDRQQPG